VDSLLGKHPRTIRGGQKFVKIGSWDAWRLAYKNFQKDGLEATLANAKKKLGRVSLEKPDPLGGSGQVAGNQRKEVLLV